MSPRLSLSLLGVLLLAAASTAQDAAQPLEVSKVDFRPRTVKVGDEITVTATIRNTTPRLLLVNSRVVLPGQVVPVVPEAEQIVFIEGTASRVVTWRAKVVKEGTWSVRVSAEVVSEGRPVNGPAPEIAAAVKDALGKAWTGTWTSPTGFVYDAELGLQVHPNGSVDGRLHWTLVQAPADRKDYAGKAGAKGVEFLWGTFDAPTRNLDLAGYRRDDPQIILGLDKYRLTLSENGAEIKGATWNHGTWTAAFRLVPVVPVVTEDRKLGGFPEGISSMVVGSLQLRGDRNSVAFMSRTGKEAHVIEGDKIIATGPGFAGVRLEKYVSGGRLLYSVSSPGASYFMLGTGKSPLFDKLHYVVVGANGRVGYHAEKGGRHILGDGATTEEFDDLNGPSLSKDGLHLAYAAKIAGRWITVIDGKRSDPHDGLWYLPSFHGKDNLALYVALRANKHVAMMGDRELGEFDNIQAIDVSEDGRTVVIAAAEGGKMAPWFGIQVYKGGRHFVTVNGVRGEDFDEIGYPRMSPSGRVAYTARKGTAWSVVIDGKKGPDFDGVGRTPVFSPDERHVAYPANVGGKYDVDLRFQSGGVDWLVVDHEMVTSPIIPIDLYFSPDGKTVAYEQRVDRKRQLVVGKVKGPAVDDLYGNTVEFSPDGRKVSYVALVGRDLWLQTLTLEAPAGRDPAKESAARATLMALRTAIGLYEVDTGRYPTTEMGLPALVAKPDGVKGWKGPYIEGRVPQDPWGNPFGYRSPGTKNPAGFDLFSSGPDGKPGTEDDLDR